MTKRRTKNRTKNGKRRNTKQIKRKTYRKIYNKTKRGGMFRAVGNLVPQCLKPRSLIHLVVARWRLIDPDNNINWNDENLTSNDNERFTCILRDTTNKFNLDEKILGNFEKKQYLEFVKRKESGELAESILQSDSKYDSIARIFKPEHKDKIICLLTDLYKIFKLINHDHKDRDYDSNPEKRSYRFTLNDLSNYYFEWYNNINVENQITNKDGSIKTREIANHDSAAIGSNIGSTHYGFRTATQNDDYLEL